MDIATLALLFVGASFTGVAGVMVGCRRAATVEVAANPTAEARLLAALANQPELASAYRNTTGVDSDHFTLVEHREWWEQLPEPEDGPPDGVAAALQAETLHHDRDQLQQGLDSNDLDLSVVHANLVDDYEQREVHVGSAGRHWLPTRTNNPQRRFEQPLQRTSVPVTGTRLAGGAASGLFAGVAGWSGLHLAGYTAADQLLVSLLVLLPFIFGAATIAQVDRATHYLDEPAAVLWMVVLAATIATSLLLGADLALGPAFAVAAVIIVTFEALAWLQRRRRNSDSLGLGDTLVMPVGIGVPLLLAMPPSPSAAQVYGAFGLMVVAHIAVTVTLFVLFDFKRGANRSNQAAGLPGWLFGPLLMTPAVAALS